MEYEIPLPPSSYEGSEASNDSDNCDCDYCREYSYKYNLILKSDPMWLTISPPASDRDPSIEYNEWLLDFEDLLKCADNILGVVEFANYRMHFHIMYSCKDNIKSYRLVNKFRRSSMVRIYKGAPKKGLHYLFKDINKITKLILPSDSVIYTDETLDDRRQNRIQSRRKKLLVESTNEIPEWMLKKE